MRGILAGMSSPASGTTAPRRPFQFRLGTLLLAVTLLGVCLGIRINPVRRERAAASAIAGVSGRVYYDYQFDADGHVNARAEPPGPAWLRRWLGDDFFSRIVLVDLHTAHDLDRCLPKLLPHLQALPELRSLDVHDRLMGDAGLESILQLHRLESLDLSSTHISDRGLARLGALRHLHRLDLRNLRALRQPSLQFLDHLTELEQLELGPAIKLADCELAHLRPFAANVPIETLKLRITGSCDGDLSVLKELAQLKHLSLSGSQIGDAGCRALAKLSKLESLTVLGVQHCADGWQWLAGLQSLGGLHFYPEPFDEGALKHLSGLRKLGGIALPRSDAALKQLKKDHPGCTIFVAP